MHAIDTNTVPAPPGNGLQQIVECLVAAVRGCRTVYIKPNFTTPAPLRGVSTEPDLVRVVASCLASPRRSVFLCESDTKTRSAREAFEAHLAGSTPEGCILAKLTSWEKHLTITSLSGTWTLPDFVRDPEGMLINLACLKDNAAYRTSGPVKNLFGLVREARKERIHRLPVGDLFDLLWTIVDNVRMRMVNVVDGRWQWVGDFDRGSAAYRGVMALSPDLLALEDWATRQCVTFSERATVLDARPGCRAGIREDAVSVFSADEPSPRGPAERPFSKEACG
jgi:uncharacterized protein (DUF362 family)